MSGMVTTSIPSRELVLPGSCSGFHPLLLNVMGFVSECLLFTTSYVTPRRLGGKQNEGKQN